MGAWQLDSPCEFVFILKGATGTLQAYNKHDLLCLTTTSCTNVEIPERVSGLASLRPARG